MSGLSDVCGDEFDKLYEKYEVEHAEDNIVIDALINYGSQFVNHK